MSTRLRKRLPERAELFRQYLLAPDLEHFKREAHFAVTGSYPGGEYSKMRTMLLQTQPHVRVFQMMAQAWEFGLYEVAALFLSLPAERRAEIDEILKREIEAEVKHYQANP